MSNKQLILLAVVLIIILIGAEVMWSARSVTSTQPVTTAAPTHVDPPTPEVVAQLQKSHGFQYLISITDDGFQPAVQTIKKGETIRWTNNSSHQVSINGTGNPTPADCTDVMFDTCTPLIHNAFYEHTFTTTGTVHYSDMLNAQHTGTIQIN